MHSCVGRNTRICEKGIRPKDWIILPTPFAKHFDMNKLFEEFLRPNGAQSSPDLRAETIKVL